MMTTDQIIQEMLEQLATLPDLKGIARCAGFYLLYQGMLQLKQSISEEREKQKEEILILQAKIQDLEDDIEIKEQ